MAQGTVKWLSAEQGFGFSVPDDGTPESGAARPLRAVGEDSQGEQPVSGWDNEDPPAARLAASASSDQVRGYLRQIGKVPLLIAGQEVQLARRIEAGLFAGRKLAEGSRALSAAARIDLEQVAEDCEATEPVEAVSLTLLREQLHEILGTLSEREAGVMSLRFGLADGRPRTLDEVGNVYGVTREQVRQIESKTLSKLRHPSRSTLLREYLG